ncbi:co-chaperone DjlA [Tolumonas lignilytica]|uniref:co-chaperone DjlA n=1 Tax=Tolumonas lignilytica TaxID=1283284 RepID=UPI000463BE97|nr:co-chaperone DjlA [Tolumonas lignilytica]
MPVKGKIIGFLIGLWILNIPGALLGLWIGHVYDQGLQLQRGGFGRWRAPTREEQALFLHTAFAVMGHIAKASGRVTEQQIQIATLFMDRMGLSGDLRREAQDSFRQGKEADYDLEGALGLFRRSCRGRPDLLRVFLDMQLQAAFANGALHSASRQRLLEVAELLGFSRWELEQLLAMTEAGFNFSHQGQQQRSYSSGSAQQTPPRDRLKDAYAILGVSADVSDSDVKKAYRKQMSQHHPDKLAAKGLPPEMMNMAKEKAQEIQQAWELIKQARGIR